MASDPEVAVAVASSEADSFACCAVAAYVAAAAAAAAAAFAASSRLLPGVGGLCSMTDVMN